MGPAPPGLHRGQAEVPDLHRQTFMQEDVWEGRCQGTTTKARKQQENKILLGLHSQSTKPIQESTFQYDVWTICEENVYEYILLYKKSQQWLAFDRLGVNSALSEY